MNTQTPNASGAVRRRQIERLLRPRSIAIVGASPTSGSLGASVLENLDRFEYRGEIYLVNPKRDAIGSRPCIQSIDRLPFEVDVAVLAIPRAGVLEAMHALAARRVGAAVIFSAGFAEGGDAGVSEQRELRALADRHGILLVGPNCLGLVNYAARVPLTFVEATPRAADPRRNVAIVSQSGAMAVVLSAMLSSRAIALSVSVSTGNEAGSGVEDYLEHLLDDPGSTVIAMIVEQFRRPKQFLEVAASAAARGKTIVLLHPGRSQAARESAATHTGAIAGDYQVMQTQVERRGVILAQTLQEFGDLIELVYRCGAPRRGGTAVLTESGAFKALTLDLCDQLGLALPAMTDATAPALRAILPDFVPVSNPVDLTAQGLVDPGIYQRALAALLADTRFGAVVLGIIQTDEKTSAVKFPTIIEALRALPRDKLVLFAGLDEGASVPQAYLDALRALDVPYFSSPDRAFVALARLARRPQTIRQTRRAAQCLSGPLPEGLIPEHRSKAILASVGVPFPAGQLVQSVAQARDYARQLGVAVALKAQAVELPHKSDAGGVILNVQGDAAIDAGWTQLQANLARTKPGLKLEGILVEGMSAKGVEFIIGARNDPEWGATILAGFGGIEAEIRKDFVLLPADLEPNDIVARLHELKASALLDGFRGAPPLDVEALAELIATLGALLIGEPRIQEIDLNPVMVHPRGLGVLPLDALILARAH